MDSFKSNISAHTSLPYSDSATLLIEVIKGLHKYASSKIPLKQLHSKCSKVSEGIYDREKDKIRMVGHPYMAHVAQYQEKETITLITNWDSFYTTLASDIADDSEKYKKKLGKNNCKALIPKFPKI